MKALILSTAALLVAGSVFAEPMLTLEIASGENPDASPTKVVIELDTEHAPEHAKRIETLAAEGAYDDVVFHRVIDGFMAQTGDVQFGKRDGDVSRAGTGGSSYDDLPAEFSDEAFERGVVGMARSNNPDSANSQFFIMFDAGRFLDGQYTVVGHVVDGMDAVDAIKRGDDRNNGLVAGPMDYIASATITDE